MERRRLKICLEAYACAPAGGSEPGVGWQVAVEWATHHEVWVLTRANNRALIEAELNRRRGPVGGGDSSPRSFWPGLGLRGAVYEAVRDGARWLAERDPLVRRTARRATLALGTTPHTVECLERIGAARVGLMSQVPFPDEELTALASLPAPPERPFRLVSVGRLLALKGFHLGLRAFARAAMADGEYWIIGDGPERRRLERMARDLGIAPRVRFFGWLPRPEMLQLLGQAHVLVHPSLHDSGGWVCLEAMAAGRPVICLDLGGPALQVTSETGFVVPASEPETAVAGMVSAMRQLASDPARYRHLAAAARERAAEFRRSRHRERLEAWIETMGSARRRHGARAPGHVVTG